MKMPRKRREAATPKPAALASSAEVEEATREMIARLGDDERSPKRIKKDDAAAEAEAARFIATGVIDERHASEPVKPPKWDENLAKITAKSATDRATIAPTATEGVEATADATEPPKPPRTPRRYTAGHAGFIDPRFYDEDDDDGWIS